MNILGLFIFLMAISYLFSVFIPHVSLVYVYSIISLGALVISLPKIKGAHRVTSIILIGIGFALLALNHGNPTSYLLNFGGNANILSLFILVPLLRIPIRAGKYLDALDVFYAHYIKTKNQFYLFTVNLTHLLSVLLNLGAVPLVHQIIHSDEKKKVPMLKVNALTRGYSIAVFWSPYFISVGLVLANFPISWIEIFPIGITLSIIGVFAGYFLEKRNKEELPIELLFTPVEKNGQTDIKTAWRKISSLIIIALIITAAIFTLEWVTEIKIIAIITLVSIVTSIIWTIGVANFKTYKKEFSIYFNENLPSMKNEVVVFISAGFLGQSFISVGGSEWLLSVVEFFNLQEVFLLIPAILFVTFLLSFIGLHPIVSLTAFCMSFGSADVFADSYRVLGVALIAAWGMSVMISPFSGITLLTSSLTKKSSFHIGKANLLFTGIMVVILIVLLDILHYGFGY